MLGAAPRGPGERSRPAPLTGAGMAGLGLPAAAVTVTPPCLLEPVVFRVSVESACGIARAGAKWAAQPGQPLG